jgi:hypothetical protein
MISLNGNYIQVNVFTIRLAARSSETVQQQFQFIKEYNQAWTQAPLAAPLLKCRQ